VRAADYETTLELSDLLGRIKSGRYHAPPVRRAYIPKADGTQLGIPTFEDKVAQRAVVLEAIYEQDFLPCSYGFRPGRSAHQALDALRAAFMGQGVRWCIDVDIKKYFDTIDHGHLRDFLNRRVTDGVMRRMIDKWLKAGVLEEGRLHRPTAGSGGVVSPCLSNVYLHSVLDEWFERDVRPRLTGRAILVRYADDVRHFTGRWIPFTERRGLEETTLGPTAYPAVKAKGDRSMPSKRERPEDADGRVPQGPRDKVRTALFEPQSPGMQAYIPRHSV
jgi:RNA-directed DNA polymerase